MPLESVFIYPVGDGRQVREVHHFGNASEPPCVFEAERPRVEIQVFEDGRVLVGTECVRHPADLRAHGRTGSSPRPTRPRCTLPAVGMSRVTMMRIVVVLPEPLAPMNPTTWPRKMSNDTSRTASTLPNLRERLRTEIIGSPPPGGGGGGTAAMGGGIAGSGGGFIGEWVRSTRDGNRAREKSLLLLPADRRQRLEERPVLRHCDEVSATLVEGIQGGVQALAAAGRQRDTRVRAAGVERDAFAGAQTIANPPGVRRRRGSRYS